MTYLKILIYALATLMATSTLVFADDDDDDDGGIEIQLDEAYLYFELNDTDGDLGLHGKADGDAWKKMSIKGPEGPKERTIMKIKAKSGLRRQGLTELFFESAEPTFDELHPDVFFSRFPEGWYEWEGKTIDNEEIEGEVYLSQIIPAAPVVASVGEGMVQVNPGFEENDEGDLEKLCWVGIEPLPGVGGVVIDWDAVTDSHFDKWSNGADPLPEEGEKIPLGVTGVLPALVYYEFVAEFDGTEFKTTALIPPGVTEWTIPAEFIAFAVGLVDDEGEAVEEVKFEIIVRVETYRIFEDEDGNDVVGPTLGNQSAVEDYFVIP